MTHLIHYLDPNPKQKLENQPNDISAKETKTLFSAQLFQLAWLTGI